MKTKSMEDARMKTQKTVTYVGGSKGGTGKSLVSMALVDYLRRTFPEDKILLIETDSSNPGVCPLYLHLRVPF
jgi:MinD superfamily P-loop ATPase